MQVKELWNEILMYFCRCRYLNWMQTNGIELVFEVVVIYCTLEFRYELKGTYYDEEST
jgi:hypothetical protein